MSRFLRLTLFCVTYLICVHALARKIALMIVIYERLVLLHPLLVTWALSHVMDFLFTLTLIITTPS